MSDRYENKAGLTQPAVGIAAVTPDDDTDLTEISRGIMVATAGNVAVHMMDGSTGILPALTAGMVHPFRVRRVLATDTTATGIVAVY